MEIKIFHFTNAGLLFDCSKKILIDGIYGGDNVIQEAGMSDMTADSIKDLMENRGVFYNVALVLFSHQHIYHYNKMVVDQYLSKNEGVGFFAPGDKRNNIAVNQIEQGVFSLGVEDVELYAIFTKHQYTGDNKEKIEHLSYLLNFEGKSFFVAGDGVLDLCSCQMVRKYSGTRKLFCFFNVMHIAERAGIKIIEYLKPEKILIYHLPLKSDDVFNYYAIVRQAKKNYLKKGIVLEVVKHLKYETY